MTYLVASFLALFTSSSAVANDNQVPLDHPCIPALLKEAREASSDFRKATIDKVYFSRPNLFHVYLMGGASVSVVMDPKTCHAKADLSSDNDDNRDCGDNCVGDGPG